MFARRATAFVVSAALTIGGGLGVALLTAGNADALGITHKAVMKGNGNWYAGLGDAIEGAADATFQCNDVTGAYKVAIKGLSVIDADGITPFDSTGPLGTTYYVYMSVADVATETHVLLKYFALSQDPKTGLFGMKASGTMPDVGACLTGTYIDIQAYAGANTPYDVESHLT